MGRTGCCSRIYTTRQYDPGGATLWIGNYQDGGTQDGGMTSITCMAVDATQVYCGHPRQTKSGTSWNVTALDISTGAINWKYDIGSGKQPKQLRFDQSGNLVVMEYVVPNPSTAQTERFYTLNTSGVLQSTKTFTQVKTGSDAEWVQDFIITSGGDYHLVTARGTGAAASSPANGIYEWLSPQSSSPTFYASTVTTSTLASYTSHLYSHLTEGGVCIQRIGGQDFVGYGQQGANDLVTPAWGFGRMVAMSGVARSVGNVDLYSPFGYATSPASVTSAGSTQGTATAIAAPSVLLSVNSGGNLTGVLLPSASIGDILVLQLISLGTPTINVYPQSGGSIIAFDGTQYAVNAPHPLTTATNLFCHYRGSGNWEIRKSSERNRVIHLDVDLNGCIYTASPTSTPRSDLMRKSTIDGVLLWAKGGSGINNLVAVDDTATYCYSAGQNNNLNFLQRDASTGVFQWGHLHLTVNGKSGIYYDTAADTITVNGMPKSTSTDANFVSNPYT